MMSNGEEYLIKSGELPCPQCEDGKLQRDGYDEWHCPLCGFHDGNFDSHIVIVQLMMRQAYAWLRRKA